MSVKNVKGSPVSTFVGIILIIVSLLIIGVPILIAVKTSTVTAIDSSYIYVSSGLLLLGIVSVFSPDSLVPIIKSLLNPKKNE